MLFHHITQIVTMSSFQSYRSIALIAMMSLVKSSLITGVNGKQALASHYM